MRPLLRIQERLAALEAAGLYRDPNRAVLDAGELEPGVVDARSNDYLGLARRSVSRETGGEAVRLGAGGARLISGTSPEHLGLERELAEWLGVESSLLFSSAYAANVGALSSLGAAGDTIFSDALNHASIIDGCRLSRATVVVVPHRDLAALAAGLRERARGDGTCWVVSETYFGMDGTSPDLAALRRLCDDHEAALLLDEAHALGIFGPEGRGLAAAAAVVPDLVVGGFGKAFGLHGGFVAGPQTYQRWLWNRARSFVFSTAPSPLLCQLGREQLRELRGADAERERLAEHALRLEGRLRAGGVPLPPERHGPIFPLVLGSEAAALEAAVALRPLGVVGHAIRPPTVPAGTSRLRVSLRADMSEDEVDRLGAALIAVWPSQASAPDSSGGADAALAPDRGSDGTPGAPPSPPAQPRRWVVLATGTGVGKTFVTEALVRLIAARGYAVAGLKPIETGCRSTPEGIPVEGDAARLEAASFHVKHPRPHPLYAFSDPIAPSLASRRDGQAIEPESIASWIDRVRWLEPSPIPEPTQGPPTSWRASSPPSSLASPSPPSSSASPSAGAPASSSAAPSSDGSPNSSGPPSSSAGLTSRVPPASSAAPTTGAISSRPSWRPSGPVATPTTPAALVIETAGGVFSPLTEQLTNFDLAHCVGRAQWILVAPDRLGVLHEVMSTVQAMRSLGRAPDWLVLNAPPSPDASTGTNAAELRRLGVLTPLLCLARDDASGLSALLEDSGLDGTDPSSQPSSEPSR